jgi:L-serine dehydratase
MAGRSSIFDMIGPVMIGPSSSHTAGVVRIGRVARRILGVQPTHATVTFYNSFARTYEGHGSDRAVIAGLLDMPTDDERIKEGLKAGQDAGLEFHFRSVNNASALHPNSIRIKTSAGDKETEVLGISRGGGLISIVEVDGLRCNFTAQHHTLLLTAKDVMGSVAFISSVVAHDECNIAAMTVDREGKALSARLVFEMDSPLRPLTLEYLKSLSWIENVTYIPDIHL